MAYQLPNGAIISIASAYGVVKNMTAVSNANPAEATLEASHGVASGEFIEIVSSGWNRLAGRIVRAGTVATNQVPLSGINSSSTTLYPAGTGGGTVREISTWTQMSQVLEFETNGGEMNYANLQFLEEDFERRIPTYKSAQGFTMSIADDPNLAWYPVVEAADADRIARAVRLTLPNGSILLYNAILTMNKTPTLTKNNVMAIQVTASFSGQPTRYAS